MAHQHNDNIPVYCSDGVTLFKWMTPIELHGLKNVRLCANKRGYVHRAYLTGNECVRPISQGNAGQVYDEQLTCGHVWAMVMAPISA